MRINRPGFHFGPKGASGPAPEPRCDGLIETVDSLCVLGLDRSNTAAIHGGKKVRWHQSAFPLKVRVEQPGSETGQLIMAVLKEWEAVSGGWVRLAFMEAGNAHIEIKWTDEPTRGREYEVGHTNRKVQPAGWISEARITLLENPIIDRHLTSREQANRLRATILHEFGHALGLNHSHNERDVMHHRGWRNHSLSPGDIKALLELYQPDMRHVDSFYSSTR